MAWYVDESIQYLSELMQLQVSRLNLRLSQLSVAGRAAQVFYLGLGSDLILWFLRPGLIGLKGANREFGLKLSPRDESI